MSPKKGENSNVRRASVLTGMSRLRRYKSVDEFPQKQILKFLHSCSHAV